MTSILRAASCSRGAEKASRLSNRLFAFGGVMVITGWVAALGYLNPSGWPLLLGGLLLLSAATAVTFVLSLALFFRMKHGYRTLHRIPAGEEDQHSVNSRCRCRPLSIAPGLIQHHNLVEGDNPTCTQAWELHFK